MSYRLRKSHTNDLEFVKNLFRESMGPYVEKALAWDKDHQFRVMEKWFDPERVQIICLGDRDIGLLAYEKRADEIFLESISILPEFQGRGLGGSIVQKILLEARGLQLPVRLRVLKNNPARRLYERLGFKRIDEDPVHFYLRWEP